MSNSKYPNEQTFVLTIGLPNNETKVERHRNRTSLLISPISASQYRDLVNDLIKSYKTVTGLEPEWEEL